MHGQKEQAEGSGLLSGVGRDWKLGMVLAAPILVWLSVFLVYPLANTVIASFHNTRLGMPRGSFVGLDTYRFILTEDDRFWGAVGNSVVFTAGSVALQTVFGLGTALLLHRSFPGRTFLRAWVILPWVVPFSVVAAMARWMLSSSFGVVNWILLQVGFLSSPVSFLANPDLAMFTAISVNSYKWFAFVGVMYLAVLQGIPEDLYEAARIDGSTKRQEFRYITLPALLPTMSIVTLLITFFNFNTFGLIWLLTRGGPGGTTTTLPVLIYRRAFQGFRISEAAAISLVMFVMLLAFTIAYQTIRERWVEE